MLLELEVDRGAALSSGGEDLSAAIAAVARDGEPRTVVVGQSSVRIVRRPDPGETASKSIYFVDTDGRVAGWNLDAVAERARSGRVIAAAAAGGIVEEHGWRSRHDGSRFWADTLVAPLRDQAGSLRGYVEVTRDLTERRVAEDRLLESERRFRVMADSAPVMLWMSGLDANCHFFNRGWLEFTGRTMEQEMGVGWAEGVLAEDFQRCMDVYLEAFVMRRAFRMEYRMRRADGVYRWILDNGVPLFGAGGRFEGYIGSCIDITEIHDAREASEDLAAELERRVVSRTAELRSALDEREVLLREIHHRVKNNLQLISSLLSLQARHLDGAARELVEDAQSRVRSIALLHDKLYGSRDLSAVDFGRYTRELVGAVVRASGSPQVAVALDVDDVQLAVDLAIPCGLIMNELLTNAFKHAFPGGREGTVRVAVLRAGEGGLSLTVGDDGVGLPPHLDIERRSTLGLELVFTLARQLGAEVELERERGTRVRLNLHGARP